MRHKQSKKASVVVLNYVAAMLDRFTYMELQEEDPLCSNFIEFLHKELNEEMWEAYPRSGDPMDRSVKKEAWNRIVSNLKYITSEDVRKWAEQVDVSRLETHCEMIMSHQI
jgi:hypothetical protein